MKRICGRQQGHLKGSRGSDRPRVHYSYVRPPQSTQLTTSAQTNQKGQSPGSFPPSFQTSPSGPVSKPADEEGGQSRIGNAHTYWHGLSGGATLQVVLIISAGHDYCSPGYHPCCAVDWSTSTMCHSSVASMHQMLLSHISPQTVSQPSGIPGRGLNALGQSHCSLPPCTLTTATQAQRCV